MPRHAEAMSQSSKVSSTKHESANVLEQRKRMENSIKEHTELFRTFSENGFAVVDLILDEVEDAIAREEAIAPEHASEYRDDLTKTRNELLQLQAISDRLPELKAEREQFADTIQKNDETIRRITNALNYLSGRKPRRVRAAAPAPAPAEDEEKITKLRKSISTEQSADEQEAAPISGVRLKEKEPDAEIEFAEAEIQFVIPPQEKITKEYEAAQKKLASRLHVSLEEARQAVPHGDRIWSFVYDKVNATKGIGKIYAETEQDVTISFHNFDATTDYVRLLAKYRRGVERNDDELRQEALGQITRINEELGIEGNALIEQVFDKKDLGFANLRKAEAWRNQQSKELAASTEQVAEDMDIETAKRFIKYADKVWDLAQERIQELGEDNAERLNHREAATRYVYALAAYNRSVRQLNEGEIAKTITVLGKMNRSLGLAGNALVQAMMERYNVTRLKNPFEK